MQSVAIELQHLTKIYGSGDLAVKAVDDVSLHIPEGEIVAIMGPSGSGKTTLLQMVGAMLKPSSGDVIISGKNIAVLPENDLCRIRLHTFGFIFQTPNLLASLTAAQNVELVMNLANHRGEKPRLRAIELLEELHLNHRLHYKPAKLSGGEQQRVAIARALANDPPVLLADEPTANLDSRTGHQVMELLRVIAKEKGKTVVVVSHDSRIRDVVDRVLWLEDGHLRVRWTNGAVIDPVCLMIVAEDKVFATSEYNGQKYCFCSEQCLKEFQSNPQRFTKPTIKDS
ncbi:MAG: ATP-binding cassette domain-containing protein [Chloroflexi bacterium]|nr:ATP-binding cassette domain-containing protein [Chloroflexota bacterium]